MIGPTRDYYQPPDPKVVCRCDNCGGEIYDGEACFELLGEMFCEDCIDGAIKDEFGNLSFADRLDTVGGKVKIVKEEDLKF